MSLRDRIRRFLLGPTNDEISAYSIAHGGPPYPIPPMQVTAPTNTTVPADLSTWHALDPPDDRAAMRERARRAAAAMRADEIPLDPTRADRAAAAAAIRHVTFETAVENAERGRRRLDNLAGLAAFHEAGMAAADLPEPLTTRPATTGAAVTNQPTPGMDDDEGMERPYDGRPGGSRPAPPANTRTQPAAPTPADSGVHHLPDNAPTVNTPCTTCGGTGIMARTVNGLLTETIAMIPVDGGDQVIREFYRRLLTAAPQLANLFPADLITSATQDGASPGAMQRDRLLQALIALADLYGTGPEGMTRLDTALGSFGRSHAAFARPDGTTRGATVAEYLAVKDTLFGTLAWALGDKLTPAHVQAWSDAYDYAMVGMLYAQQHSDMHFPRQARGSARVGDHSE